MGCVFFFFQAEDGIRALVRSRGLGDVYKRQALDLGATARAMVAWARLRRASGIPISCTAWAAALSLIHI